MVLLFRLLFVNFVEFNTSGDFGYKLTMKWHLLLFYVFGNCRSVGYFPLTTFHIHFNLRLQLKVSSLLFFLIVLTDL